MKKLTACALLLCLSLGAAAAPPLQNTNFIDTPFSLLGEEMRVVNRDGSMRSRRARTVTLRSGRWLAWDWLPPYFEPYRAETADMDIRPKGASAMRTAYERLEAVQCRYDGFVERGWGTREAVRAGQILVREWNDPRAPGRVQVLEPQEFTKRYVNPDGSEIKLPGLKTPKPPARAPFNLPEMTALMRHVYQAAQSLDYAHVPADVLPRLRLTRPVALADAESFVFTRADGKPLPVKTVPLSQVYDVRGVLYYNAPAELAVAPAPGVFGAVKVERGDLFSLQTANGHTYLDRHFKPLDVVRYNTPFLPPQAKALARLTEETLAANPVQTQRRLLKQKSLLPDPLLNPRAPAAQMQLAALRRAFYDYQEAAAQFNRVWKARGQDGVKQSGLTEEYLKRVRQNKQELTRRLKSYGLRPGSARAKALVRAGAGLAKMAVLAGGLDLLFRLIDDMAAPQTAAASVQALGMAEREKLVALLKEFPEWAAAAPPEVVEEAAQTPGADPYALAAALYLYGDFISQSQIPGTPQQILLEQTLAQTELEEQMQNAF